MNNNSFSSIDSNESKIGHGHDSMTKYGYWVVLLSAIMICAVLPILSAYIGRRRTSRLLIWLVITLWCLGIITVLVAAQPTQLNLWAKLLGRITYASLPLVLILSFRPSYLPSTTYLWVLQWHKWIARVAGLVVFGHGVLYTWYFARTGEIYKMFRPRNFLGSVALALFCILAFLSLRPVRRQFYSFFYTSHYISAWGIVLLGLIHARPNVFFLAALCICVLASQILWRIVHARDSELKVQDHGGSMITVTLTRSALPQHFEPGSHIRIGPPLCSWRAWIQPSHPYTIASLDTDNNVKLVIRRTNFDLQRWSSYSITGPFKSSYAHSMASKNVLLIAGGSGISLAIPVLRQLTFERVLCKCVWITSQADDTSVLRELDCSTSNISIYLTVDFEVANDTKSDSSDRGIELEELLPSACGASDFRDLKIQHGRPSMEEIVQGFTKLIEDDNKSCISVVACGPASLIEDAETVAAAHNLPFYNEEYSI